MGRRGRRGRRGRKEEKGVGEGWKARFTERDMDGRSGRVWTILIVFVEYFLKLMSTSSG